MLQRALKAGMTYWKYYKRVKKQFPDRQSSQYRLPSETYYKYLKTETFDGKRVLNIGCGKNVYKVPNVVNLDICSGDGVNVVWDLSKTPLPFESNSFDLIIANHVLEHVPSWFECFKELARIAKVGGQIEVWIPPVSSDSAFTYRDHINTIGDYSFAGCLSVKRSGTNLAAAKEFNEMAEFINLEITTRYIKMTTQWWVIFAPQALQGWMTDHLRNVVSEVGYIFRKGE
jgi:SAM-dependent methyltransferase